MGRIQEAIFGVVITSIAASEYVDDVIALDRAKTETSSGAPQNIPNADRPIRLEIGADVTATIIGVVFIGKALIGGKKNHSAR